MALALGSPGVLETGVQGLGRQKQRQQYSGLRSGFVGAETTRLGFIGASVCGEARIAGAGESSGSGNCGSRILSVSASVSWVPRQHRQEIVKDEGSVSVKRAGICDIRAATAPGRSGGGVLDRPILEKPTPGRESEFDLKKSRKLSPPYRVMLHNDSYNKREYVVQVLMKVIPGMSVDSAVNIMQEAHVNGLAVVIICSQNDAEEHCMSLRNNGLLSSIEPASGGC
ncbi:hypothetical protein R1sor_001318 [Riccia sorocarpa]|uniref:Adaptor protein ClpS core domain-containing protein n=1 Tax=Riccia sorocarpa TaxID=122646 RepID=A0ABD3GXK1_9MARC